MIYDSQYIMYDAAWHLPVSNISNKNWKKRIPLRPAWICSSTPPFDGQISMNHMHICVVHHYPLSDESLDIQNL